MVWTSDRSAGRQSMIRPALGMGRSRSARDVPLRGALGESGWLQVRVTNDLPAKRCAGGYDEEECFSREVLLSATRHQEALWETMSRGSPLLSWPGTGSIPGASRLPSLWLRNEIHGRERVVVQDNERVSNFTRWATRSATPTTLRRSRTYR